jgi:hypothetical protein
MPICPKNEDCGHIDHLHAFAEETNKYEIYLEENLFPESGHTGLNWSRPTPMEGSATRTVFNCPKCEDTIFEFEGEDAENWAVVELFLKS